MLPFFRHVALLLPWVVGALVHKGRGYRNGNRVQMAVGTMEKAHQEMNQICCIPGTGNT